MDTAGTAWYQGHDNDYNDDDDGDGDDNDDGDDDDDDNNTSAEACYELANKFSPFSGYVAHEKLLTQSQVNITWYTTLKYIHMSKRNRWIYR